MPNLTVARAARSVQHQRREDRYVARDLLRVITDLNRVRDCGWKPIGTDVVVRGGDGSAGIAGVARCGSTWCCPVCAAKIAEHRRTDLHGLLAKHHASGGGLGLLTLTMRHHRGQRLADLWDALSVAWRSLQAHRTWRQHVRPDLLGWVRVVEVTHGANGWHVHLHAILVLQPGRVVRPEWESIVTGTWATVLQRRGFSASWQGQQLRQLTGDPSAALGDYFAKAVYEVSRGDLKAGRKGSRTPFELLRSLVDTTSGELSQTWDQDRDLWREWEQASHGRRQWGWSKGLRDALQADAVVEDQDAADEAPGSEDLLLLPADSWRSLRDKPRLLVQMLEAAELGRSSLSAWLDARRIEWVPLGEPPAT